MSAALSMMGSKPQRKPEGQPGTLQGYLKKLKTDFQQPQQSSMLARYFGWAQQELWWRGDQLSEYNLETNRYQPMDDDEADLYFINNIMLPFIESIAAEYGKSKPRLICYSEAGDDRKLTGAIQNAQYLVDYWGQTLWTPEDMQREAHMIQFRSVVFTRTFWDPNAGPKVAMPQFGDMQAQLDPETMARYASAQGSQQRPTGAVRSEAIDPFQVRIWDRAYTPETSPFLEYSKAELKSRILKLYQHLDKIPQMKSGADGWGPDSGLAFKRRLELAISNTEADAMSGGYYSGSNQQGWEIDDELTCVHSAIHYDNDAIDYITQQDERIPGSDEVIPKGTQIAEVYPDGMKVCEVNGEEVAVYNLNKNDEWSGYKFAVAVAGFYGVGSENLLGQQEWLNEISSLIMTGALYASNGITVFDSSKVKNGSWVNKPGTGVPVEDMMPNERLADVVMHLTTSGLDPVLMQMPDYLKESAQFTSGARNSQVSGQPGPGTNTATGVNNMAATADSAAAVKLELRAHCQARRMEQALKLTQTHQGYPRYFGKFGDTKGRWLRGFDIPGDIRVRVEEDSHQPITNADRQRDTAGAIQLGYGQGKLVPEVEEEIGKAFNIKPTAKRTADWETLGQLRLEEMEAIEKQAMEMMQQRGVDPEAGAEFVLQEMIAAAMPDPLLDDHAALIKFYGDYYLSDAYREASPTMQTAIHQLVQLHMTGGVAQQQEETAMAVEAERPAVEAQQEAQGAQEREAEGAKGREGEAARDHEAATGERAHERKLEENEQKHQHAMEIEEKKSKGRGQK